MTEPRHSFYVYRRVNGRNRSGKPWSVQFAVTAGEALVKALVRLKVRWTVGKAEATLIEDPRVTFEALDAGPLEPRRR